MVGAIDWNFVPAIPPELMLLPDWFPINLYEMSSWTRGIVIPLAIVYAHKPAWSLPEGVTVEELFRQSGRQAALARVGSGSVVSWKNVFLALGRGVKFYEKLSWLPFRKMALSLARNWMLERLERSEGLGTIYPAMMNSIFALAAESGDTTDPLLAREINFLARYEIEEADTLRVQPCISPLWDTAIAMVSLEEAGLDPAHPALARRVALAGGQSNSRARRLAGEESRCGAGRLGVRISQRFLSRRGRHRIRSDGAGPRGQIRNRSACAPRFAAVLRGSSACRMKTAAGARSITKIISTS